MSHLSEVTSPLSASMPPLEPDRRTRLWRTFLERRDALYADLGGRMALSYMEASLGERYVWMELQHQIDEARLAAGEAVDLARHVQRLNALIGVARTLGIRRKARDTLQDYLRGRTDDS